MPLWTLFGLTHGKATTAWPNGKAGDGQENLLGMPRFAPERCETGCSECAASCPTGAITVRQEQPGHDRLVVDYGRCVVCQLCVEACPNDAATSLVRLGVRRSRSIRPFSDRAGRTLPRIGSPAESRAGFRRSLHIRHVDAGSCNGCESELQALNNPFYNLHRFGIFFTPSPRFADLLLVTGPVTYAMHEPLRRAYEAMPSPRWVMAYRHLCRFGRRRVRRLRLRQRS